MNEIIFTPELAEKSLPLVKSIVRDILEVGKELKILHMEQNDLNDSSVELGNHMNRLLFELEKIGCSYKDFNFEVGLVDFPAVVNGKPVLLCWKSDEEHILHYHNYIDGFSGRKQIPEELLDHISHTESI